MVAKIKQQTGFTIVELLIVIVVIAILATITIVTYNGIRSRAETSASVSAHEIVMKKAKLVKVITGHYPTSLADFELNSETSLAGSGITFSAVALDGTESPDTILYSICSPDTPTGMKIRYYDYSTKTIIYTDTGTLVGPCTVISS